MNINHCSVFIIYGYLTAVFTIISGHYFNDTNDLETIFNQTNDDYDYILKDYILAKKSSDKIEKFQIQPLENGTNFPVFESMEQLANCIQIVTIIVSLILFVFCYLFYIYKCKRKNNPI